MLIKFLFIFVMLQNSKGNLLAVSVFHFHKSVPLLKQSPDKRSVTAHVSIEKPEQWIKKQTVLQQMSHFPSNEKREKNISIHQSYRVSMLIKVPQMTYLKC